MICLNTPFLATMQRDIKKDLINLESAVDQLLAENQSLREKVQNFRKDDAIQAAENELDSVRSRALCIMSERELSADRDFRSRHWESCSNSGNYIYDLTSTGVGTVIKIKCPKCGKEEDITDLSAW